MRFLAFFLLCMVLGQAWADSYVPTRVIRAREILTAGDITRTEAEVPGAVQSVSDLIGQEAKKALYPGRSIHPSDIGPPAMVDRNDIVILLYQSGGLQIATDGRALGRASVGETLKVMNLASRSSVWGRVRADGQVEVIK